MEESKNHCQLKMKNPDIKTAQSRNHDDEDDDDKYSYDRNNFQKLDSHDSSWMPNDGTEEKPKRLPKPSSKKSDGPIFQTTRISRHGNEFSLFNSDGPDAIGQKRLHHSLAASSSDCDRVELRGGGINDHKKPRKGQNAAAGSKAGAKQPAKPATKLAAKAKAKQTHLNAQQVNPSKKSKTST